MEFPFPHENSESHKIDISFIMASVIPSNLAQTARRLLQSSAQSSKTGLYVTRRTFAAAGDKFDRGKVSNKITLIML